MDLRNYYERTLHMILKVFEFRSLISQKEKMVIII